MKTLNVIKAALISSVVLCGAIVASAHAEECKPEAATKDATEESSESWLGKHNVAINVGGLSHHFNSDSAEMLNQKHLSIGVQIDDFSINYIKNNSYGNHSIYSAWTPTAFDLDQDKLRVHWIAGVATGYSKTEKVKYNGDEYEFKNTMITNDLAPLIGIGVDYKVTSKLHVNLDITPVVAMLSVSIHLFD